MKNVLEIVDIELLLANINDGSNRLFINSNEIASSEWTGTGNYTTVIDGHTVTIAKVADTDGNIGIRKISDYTYELFKYEVGDIGLNDLKDVNILNPSSDQVLKYNGSNWTNDNVENVNVSFTEASSRSNIASGESFATILGKIKKFFSDLKTVAFTGAYSDLSGQPTIPTVNNATLTIQKNGSTVKTFTANASSDVTANISVPTKTSEITNDSSFATTSDIGNAKLTIQRNGTAVKSFTANATSNVTCNIQCEPPISWTTSGNWRYWKDNANYYHLNYYKTHTINFNTSYGTNCKIPSSALSIDLPVTINGGTGVVASAMINGYVVALSVNSLESTKIKLWPVIFNASGSLSVGINISLIGY